jgi:hypothetical protein
MLKITKENRLYSAATTRHTPNYIVYVSVYINTTITVQYRERKEGNKEDGSLKEEIRG